MARSLDRQQRYLDEALEGFVRCNPTLNKTDAMLDLAETLGLSSTASVQKWCYGKEKRPRSVPDAHIPALAEWAKHEAGMPRQWLRGFLHALGYPVRSLEVRLFGPPDRSGPPDLFTLCREANQRLWGGHKQLTLPDYYFPRPSLGALIESFVSSERPGLILVGPSGLGKTSLTLWLVSNLSTTDLPVLAYPARRLDGSKSLPDQIAHDLALHSDHPLPLGSPLTWPLLVVFDGVNESQEMHRLTWTVDKELVDCQGLKVILTFRPESFQIMRHSVMLSTHCYFTDLTFHPSDGLECDQLAIHLLPFLDQEIPDAYEQYRQVYKLQTPFISLPVSLRENLRHPLTLQWVAKTHAGKTVPDNAADEVIPRLLDAIIAQGQLHHADVHLLEERLVPLMLVAGHWANAVPIEKVREAFAEKGKRVPDELSPLTRLADAGILASTNSRLDEPVRFAHESLYEYFIYRGLCRARSKRPDAQTFYVSLASVPPFMYGPVRCLLAEEIVSQSVRWTLNVLSSLSQPMATGVLETWCRTHPSQAHECLTRLWLSSQPRDVLARLGLRALDPPPQWRHVQLAIAAAACAINDTDLLECILLTAGPSVLPAAAREFAYLWQADQTTAQQLFGQIGQQVRNCLGLPNLVNGRAFLQVALQTLLIHGKKDEAVYFLVDQVLATLRSFSKLVRRSAVELITFWIEKELIDREGLSGNVKMAFQPTSEQRARLRALAPYLDWETPGWETETVYDCILQALQSGSILEDRLVYFSLAIHVQAQQTETMALIKKLLCQISSLHPYPPWAVGLLSMAADTLLQSHSTDQELWALFDEGFVYLIDHSDEWREYYHTTRSVRTRRQLSRATGVGPYMIMRRISGLPIDTSPVWEAIQRKVKEKDINFIHDYLYEVSVAALNRLQPRLALHMLEPVLSCNIPSVLKALANLLMQIHPVAGEDVLDFLDRATSPELLSLTATHIAKPLTYYPFSGLMGEWAYPFFAKHRSYRRLICEMATQVTFCNSLREWVRWAIERVMTELDMQSTTPAEEGDL
jgi:hypothetical protein